MRTPLFVFALATTLFFGANYKHACAQMDVPRSSSVTAASCNPDGTANIQISWDLVGSYDFWFSWFASPFLGYYNGCSYVLYVQSNLPFPAIGCIGSYTFNNLIQNTAYYYGFHINIGPRWNADPSSGYVGLGWYNITTPVCAQPTPNPPAPTSMSYSCAAGGTSVTFSWPTAPGASDYYPRFSTSSGSCPAGWTLWTDGTTCYINGLNALSVSAAITPGISYGNAWVHSGEPVDATKLAQLNAPFTCVATPTVTAASCSGGTATLNWSPVEGATNYHPIIRFPSAATCPAGWTPWGVSTTDCKQWPVAGTSITASGLPAVGGYEAFVYAYGTAWSAESSHVSFSCVVPPTVTFSGNGCILPAGGGSCNITSYWSVTGLPVGDTVDLGATGPGLATLHQNLPTIARATAEVKSLMALLIQALSVTRSSASAYPQPVSTPGTFNLKLYQHSTGAQLGTAVALVACSNGSTISRNSAWNEICVASGGNPTNGVCGTTANCSAGNSCSGGICVATSPTCSPACAGGQSCVGTNVCACPTGQSLAGGVCSTTVVGTSITILAAPTRVRKGDPAVLQYSAKNVTSCTISGPGGVSLPTVAPTGGNIATTTVSSAQATLGGVSKTTLITAQSTFTLTCATGGSPASLSAQVVVNVNPIIREN